MGKTKVLRVDPHRQTVVLKDDKQIQYGRVLIATGGVPYRPPFLGKLAEDVKNRVTTFRTIQDFQDLEKIIDKSKSVAIIGGGFLGSELAAAFSLKAKKKDLKVIQVFPEEGNLSLVLPTYLTKWTTAKLKKDGVEIHPESDIRQITKNATTGKVDILLKSDAVVSADHVVVATGLVPNIQIAKASGLEIDPLINGIVVNAELEARSDIYAAGDVTSYHDIALGRRRVEHYDHAVNSGRIAGLNMTGAKTPYTHQSMFWSNVGPEISFEAVGNLDAKLQTVSIWSKAPEDDTQAKHNKGVVYYLKDRRVCGVLLWNVFGQLDTARMILDSKKVVSDPSTLTKLINVNA
ncbi:Apoptosis-inducing factor 1, mitochondrial, partial [Kappamyces sp. JEL0680]